MGPISFVGAVGPLGRWAVGPLGRWAVGPLGRWAVGPLGRWAVGPLGRWAVGPLGRWAVGPLGRWALDMPEGRGAQASACLLSLMGWWLSIARLSCGRLLFLLLLVFSGMATPVAAQQGTVSNGCSLHQNADGCAEGQDMRFRVYTTSGQPVSQDVVVEYIIRHTAQMTINDYAFVTNGGTFEHEQDGDTGFMHFKVRLPRGQSEAFYRIRVQDDNLDEPRESFRVEQQRIVSGPGTIIRSVSFSDRWLHDTDPTPVILSGPQGDIVEDGGTKTFTVTLGRALVSGEALQVPLVFSGRAGRATDYRLSCAPAMGVTCDFSKGFIAFGSQPGAVRTATITLTAIQDTEDEGTGEDISIRLGTLNANSGKATGLHGGATGSGELRFDILDDDDTVLDPSLPVISITGGTAVMEGNPAEFTVTATPAPAADITVKLIVSDDTTSDFVASGAEGGKTVIIGTGGTASYSVNTVDDSVYEADGAVAVTVAPNADVYTVSSTAHTATVAVSDNDIAPPGTPVASFVRASSNAGEDAGTHHVAVTLSRAPASAITLGYTVGGTATAGTDYTALSGRVQVPAGTTRVTIPVVMAEDSIVEGGETVVLTLTAETGYSIGNSNIIHTLTITDNDIAPPGVPVASFVRASSSAGEDAGTHHVAVNLSRAPASAITLDYTVGGTATAGTDYTALSGRVQVAAGTTQVTIPVVMAGDSIVEGGETVVLTLTAGTGYSIDNSNIIHTLTITDNDIAPPGTPVASFVRASSNAGEDAGTHHVAVTLSRAPASAITLGYTVGGTATAGTDYTALSGRVQVAAGTTRVTIPVVMAEDSIVEGGETVVLTLTAGTGYSIGNSNIIHTLTITDNDIASDPDIPAQARHAGLVRFGRTVGEQSVSAVRDRLSADRRQGFTGSLAGQALPEVICDYDKAAPKHIPEDDAWRRNCPGAEISEDAELAGSGAGSGGPTAVTALRDWLAGPDAGAEASAGAVSRSDALDAAEVLSGTAFTLTRETDAGGALALWGRGVHSGFSGQQGGIDIDGRVTGFQLGADHARGDWTYGLMVSRSTGDIEYSAAQGGGEIGLDLTALVPYVGWDVTAGLSAWGTLGIGRGRMTLRPDGGAALNTDIDWQMAAAGLEGALVPGGTLAGTLGGADLGWSADALWTRTRSDAVPGGLVALSGKSTRLRFGLEASWERMLASGGLLRPHLEMGLRHDGGDAETGFGLEIGGGLDWSDPARGLSLGLSGRTLALHEDGAFEDWGLSVVLEYDPTPDTKRGFAARLSHDLGGAASGGREALLGPDSFPGLNEATGGADWQLEAAYGVSRGQGRVGSSYMALRGADAAEAARLGYRIEPDAPHAEDMSVDLWTEPDMQGSAGTGHSLGMDLKLKW